MQADLRDRTVRLALIDAYQDEGFDLQEAEQFLRDAVRRHLSAGLGQRVGWDRPSTVIRDLGAIGIPVDEIVDLLNAAGFTTRAGDRWWPRSVQWVIDQSREVIG